MGCLNALRNIVVLSKNLLQLANLHGEKSYNVFVQMCSHWEAEQFLNAWRKKYIRTPLVTRFNFCSIAIQITGNEILIKTKYQHVNWNGSQAQACHALYIQIFCVFIYEGWSNKKITCIRLSIFYLLFNLSLPNLCWHGERKRLDSLRCQWRTEFKIHETSCIYKKI